MARGSIRGDARSRKAALRVAFSWIAVGSLSGLLVDPHRTRAGSSAAPPDFEGLKGKCSNIFGSTPFAPEVDADASARPDVSGDSCARPYHDHVESASKRPSLTLTTCSNKPPRTRRPCRCDRFAV